MHGLKKKKKPFQHQRLHSKSGTVTFKITLTAVLKRTVFHILTYLILFLQTKKTKIN